MITKEHAVDEFVPWQCSKSWSHIITRIYDEEAAYADRCQVPQGIVFYEVGF